MDLSRIRIVRVWVAAVVLLVAFNCLSAYAQGPVPCNDPFQCAGGCKPGGTECWDVDDPVPIDNGLLILVGAALTFGLYKLHQRRQLSS